MGAWQAWALDNTVIVTPRPPPPPSCNCHFTSIRLYVFTSVPHPSMIGRGEGEPSAKQDLAQAVAAVEPSAVSREPWHPLEPKGAS